VAFVIDSQNSSSVSGTPTLKFANFAPNSTSYTYWFSSSNATTEIIKGDFKVTSLAGSNYSLAIFDSTGKLMKVSLSGAGNAYICTNTSGYPYRGSPGC